MYFSSWFSLDCIAAIPYDVGCAVYLIISRDWTHSLTLFPDYSNSEHQRGTVSQLRRRCYYWLTSRHSLAEADPPAASFQDHPTSHHFRKGGWNTSCRPHEFTSHMFTSIYA
jgi:hypothetical protein